jgi:hypothetical protein
LTQVIEHSSSRRAVVVWALVLIAVLMARASSVDSALHFSGPPVADAGVFRSSVLFRATSFPPTERLRASR